MSLKFILRMRFILCLLLFTSASSASIQVYFNHRQDRSYREFYRPIQRPGDDLEKVILEEISKARTQILVAIQELRLPRIADALIAKRNEGLDVRIILEDRYNFNIPDQPHDLSSSEGQEQNQEQSQETSRYAELVLFADLNKDGILSVSELKQRDAIYKLQQAKMTIRDDRSDGSKGSGLMHHKLIVIDQSVVVTSTANFTMSDIHGDVGEILSRGNANSLQVLRSKELAQLFSDEFGLMWSLKFGSKKLFRKKARVNVEGTYVTVQFSPFLKQVPWEETTNGLIADQLGSAKSSVRSALFVFSEQKIADALFKQRLIRPGLKIEFLIEPRFAYRYYSELLDLLGVQGINTQTCKREQGNLLWNPPLVFAGIPRLLPGDMLHHKFAVIDREKVLVGSHNWSDSANSRNDEFLLIIEKSDIAADYEREFTRVSQRAIWGVTQGLRERLREDDYFCKLSY
jgi:phosphatidylserine/phosphatidylglycerophosphate/cardiolipin synthase-like enzyme